MVGSAIADFEFYRAKALGATSLVCSAFFVCVNPQINVAAVKLYTDKLPLFLFFLFFRRIEFFRLRRQFRFTDNVKHGTTDKHYGQ